MDNLHARENVHINNQPLSHAAGLDALASGSLPKQTAQDKLGPSGLLTSNTSNSITMSFIAGTPDGNETTSFPSAYIGAEYASNVCSHGQL